MNTVVFNPKFPGDKTRAKDLTTEQFDVVRDFIVEAMNNRKRITDQDILYRLSKADKPLVFAPVMCKHCKKELTKADGVLKVVDATDDMAQYCWVDMEHGSQRHEISVNQTYP